MISHPLEETVSDNERIYVGKAARKAGIESFPGIDGISREETVLSVWKGLQGGGGGGDMQKDIAMDGEW